MSSTGMNAKPGLGQSGRSDSRCRATRIRGGRLHGDRVGLSIWDRYAATVSVWSADDFGSMVALVAFVASDGAS